MTGPPTRSTAASWLAVLVVSIGLWGIQVDYFPIPQDIRPSWYVYGWPICFGTGSRDRFALSTFSGTAAIIDLLTSLVMLIATFLAVRHLSTTRRRTLRQLLAIVTGCAVLFFVITGGLHATLSTLGFTPPRPGISEIAGNSRPLRRLLSPLILPGVVVALFAAGHTLFMCVASICQNAYSDKNKSEVPT